MPLLVQDKEAQKRVIGEYLKAADRFIKSSEFPKALEEVTKALSVEANNMYALAYNERIKVAMEAGRKKEEEERAKRLADEQKKAAAAAATKPPDTAPRAANAPDAKPQGLPVQPQPLPGAPQVPGDDMLTKIRKDAQEAAEKKADARIEAMKQEFSASQQKFQQDISHLAGQAKEAIAAKAAAEEKLGSTQINPVQASPPTGGAGEQMLALLKKFFQKAWSDGVISPDERNLLLILKNELALSDTEFATYEDENKSTSYIAQLREVWKDGLVTPEEAERLEALRKTLNISAEEHFTLEGQVRKEMQSKK